MDCRKFQEIVAEFEDRSLSPVERARADRHLRACAACRSILEIARGHLDLLSDLEKEELAGSIVRRTSGSPCLRVEGLICDYVDGMLDRDAADLVSRHLDHCAPCGSLASNLRELNTILPRLAEVRSDKRLTESILAATVGAKHRRYKAFNPRIRDLWRRLVQRPRFSFEAAYVGTLVVAVFLGNPFPTLRTLSGHALDAASQLAPQGLGGRNSELLSSLQTVAMRVSQRERSVRDFLEQARTQGESYVAASVSYQIQDTRAWLQEGFNSIRAFAKRLWAGTQKGGPRIPGS